MSILQSIKPQYCELIASGKKTIDVRKARPKIQTPFKVYIYCAIGQRIPNGFGGVSEALKQPLWKLRNGTVVNYLDVETMDVFQCEKLNGKVIGEYVCDEIKCLEPAGKEYYIEFDDNEAICLRYDEIRKYGNGKPLYLWHISDLKIYDKPKELSEFFYACKQPKGTDCSVCRDNREQTCKSITRPPQSWCYVEEV